MRTLAGKLKNYVRPQLPAMRRGVGAEGLGLVAETLLMAILLHALFALMLVDLRFTAFLYGAHGVCVRGWFAVKGLVHSSDGRCPSRVGFRNWILRYWVGVAGAIRSSGDQLVEWVFDDAFGTQSLEVGDDVSYHDFVNHRLNGHPTFLGKLGHSGTPQRGQLAQQLR